MGFERDLAINCGGLTMRNMGKDLIWSHCAESIGISKHVPCFQCYRYRIFFRKQLQCIPICSGLVSLTLVYAEAWWSLDGCWTASLHAGHEGRVNSQAQWCLMEKYVTISNFTVSVIMCSYVFSSSIFLWSFSAFPHVCCYVLPHCPWMCCIWSDAVRDLGDCFAFGASCPHCWSLQLVGTSDCCLCWNLLPVMLTRLPSGIVLQFPSVSLVILPLEIEHVPDIHILGAIYPLTGKCGLRHLLLPRCSLMVYAGLAFWKMLVFHR